eukprot:TRINITY_DN3651_c0_g1_i1.p1 TRINITY_DN3651_c0_g1~~TRINITY_DN3651_c0_g1_i1.p1  ORF type:complete len:122 (+),score=1.21 TRINITY_DN3651_c0_g1_i1:48-368(+)
MPYFGAWRIMPQGVVGSPDYFIDAFPANKEGIPFTELYLNPGDLLYFTTWHVHEVHNVEDDKLGFAIGIRPFSYIGRYIHEQFAPLSLYNLICFWGYPYHLFDLVR